MRRSHLVCCLAALLTMGSPEISSGERVSDRAPIVIAHRGASGYLPEHTLAAYRLAIEQGADFIEPDLVMTRDGVLVARHENEIGGTTDVADHPAFASRKRQKTIDGVTLEGWFTEDFTLAELKQLRARERLPELRPESARSNGRFEIPTFAEILDLVASASARGRAGASVPVGIYPETKHPSYFDSIGLSLEEPLVRMLHARGYRDANSPVFIQSFEAANLRELARMTKLPLVQLIGGPPYDLADVATYAQGVGVAKQLVIPRQPDGTLGEPTSLVREAHALGLVVHGWTFRAENAFLPREFRRGATDAGRGDLRAEIAAYLAAGLDGFFTDHPDIGVAADPAPAARTGRAPRSPDM